MLERSCDILGNSIYFLQAFSGIQQQRVVILGEGPCSTHGEISGRRVCYLTGGLFASSFRRHGRLARLQWRWSYVKDLVRLFRLGVVVLVQVDALELRYQASLLFVVVWVRLVFLLDLLRFSVIDSRVTINHVWGRLQVCSTTACSTWGLNMDSKWCSKSGGAPGLLFLMLRRTSVKKYAGIAMRWAASLLLSLPLSLSLPLPLPPLDVAVPIVAGLSNSSFAVTSAIVCHIKLRARRRPASGVISLMCLRTGAAVASIFAVVVFVLRSWGLFRLGDRCCIRWRTLPGRLNAMLLVDVGAAILACFFASIKELHLKYLKRKKGVGWHATVTETTSFFF